MKAITLLAAAACLPLAGFSTSCSTPAPPPTVIEEHNVTIVEKKAAPKPKPKPVPRSDRPEDFRAVGP